MDPAFLLLAGIASLLEPVVSIHDLNQFPPPVVVARCWEAARRARCIAAQRESVEPHRALHWWQAKCAAADAEAAWQCLSLARSADELEDRLAALAKLRAMLGWRAYGAGVMLGLPFWAFPEVTEAHPAPFVPVAAWTTQ